ncbi:MAG: hypothetical protein QG646_1947 [Euryarchaeota archaeon]|nr:hypothetical protein [Euryarchaeota archaeon]
MMKIVKFIAGIRFFVLIPIIGLAVAAFILFIEGGIELVHLLLEMFAETASTGTKSSIIVGIVEVVHLFLVGIVLFLTSLGLYQLFINVLPLPGWLKMNNIEELELNLVGITVVVLAVNYLSVIFGEQEINIAAYGVGYALPIVALAYFMKIRSEMGSSENGHVTAITEALSQAGETTQSPDKKRD